MKTLIIGEVNNNELSSGTLEIISKAKELSLDFSVITIGNSETKTLDVMILQTHILNQIQIN